MPLFASSVQPVPETIARLTRQLSDALEAAGVEPRPVHHVAMIVDELLTNLAEHGAKATMAHVSVELTDARVVAEVVDDGGPFDPRSAPAPALSPDPDERPIGGLGLMLALRLADVLDYQRRDGCNWVRFSVRRDRLNSGRAGMNVVDSKDGPVTVVVAEGRLDGTTSADFQRRLDALLTGPGSRMVVDFAGVEFVSSAGLRALLSILKKVKASQGLIAICSVRDPVREVLDIAGLTSMLPLFDERNAAIAAVDRI